MEGSHAREADYNKSRRLIPTNKISLIYLRHFPPCEDANAAKFQALSPNGEEWALVYASFFPTRVTFFLISKFKFTWELNTTTYKSDIR